MRKQVGRVLRSLGFLVKIGVGVGVGQVLWAGQPLWTFTPLTPTTLTIASTGQATVQYQVRNQTQYAKRLAMLPMLGVSANGGCTLAKKGSAGDSCTLVLTLNGANIAQTGIQGGPDVCLADANGQPNRNQCYQPSASDALRISVIPSQQANISLTGSPITTVVGWVNMPPANPPLLTVTNNSSLVAQNVQAVFPASMGNVSQDSSACTAIQPGASCQIKIYPGTLPVTATSFTVAGSNTNTLTASLTTLGLWGTNNSVTTQFYNTANGLLYIGGSFTYVGPPNPNTAPIDAQTGSPLAGYPYASGSAISYAIIPDTQGGWYVSQDATLKHVLADGRLDTNFQPGVINGTIRALALRNGTLYVGGEFTSVAGSTRQRLAALSAANGSLSSWVANANQRVRTLVFKNDVLYAGGSFTTIAGQTRNRIAALDTTSIASPLLAWNPNANGEVYSLALDGDTLYVGGAFGTIGGQTRPFAAALDTTANTNNALAWDPQPSALVNVIALRRVASTLTVYLGGTFTTVQLTARNRIAAVDGTTAALTTWNPGADNEVRSLTINSNLIYVGGLFANIGGAARRCIAALDLTVDTNNATPWAPLINRTITPEVDSIAVWGNLVYVGGGFDSLGGMVRNRIAAMDMSTGMPTSWNPNANTTVNTITGNASTIYAGGNFTNIGGQARARLAALDVTTGNATAWSADAASGVNRLLLNGSTLYVGGGFATISGATRRYLAALDTTLNTGNVLTLNANLNGGTAVRSLSLDAVNNVLYVGGSFTTPVARLLAINLLNNTVLAWNAQVSNGEVYVLQYVTNRLYAGGTFTTVAAQARNYFAEINPADASLRALNLGLTAGNGTSLVQAMLARSGIMYLGGEFTYTYGTDVLAFDQATGSIFSTWVPMTNIGAGVNVQSFSANAENVFMGGDFSGISTRNLGILQPAS